MIHREAPLLKSCLDFACICSCDIKSVERKHKYIIPSHSDTALRNHNRTYVFDETSWTALIWYIVMKNVFYTKHIENKYVWIFIKDDF